MNKTVTILLASCSMAGYLYAGGDIAPVEPAVNAPDVTESSVEASESNFYAVFKGLTIAGDKIREEGVVFDGDRGYGIGLDLGYRLGNGFAVEADFSCTKNDVTGKATGIAETFEAKYKTAALALVYTYEATEQLGIFGKLGYEYEWEKINELDIDSKEHDLIYAGGLEYSINETYKAVLEYEHSEIEGPKGDTISLGVMYNF